MLVETLNSRILLNIYKWQRKIPELLAEEAGFGLCWGENVCLNLTELQRHTGSELLLVLHLIVSLVLNAD